MDQPHSLTLSLHHNLLKPEKGTHQPHSSTARLLGTAQTFREGDETPGTLRSPSGRSVSVVRQHLKSRDAPSQAHLDCIPHQASHEQKPNPGSLCGESPNNRTPGSCLSKSERRPRGREPEAVPRGPPHSLGSMSGQCWGCPKGLGYLQEIFATIYQELDTTEAT